MKHNKVQSEMKKQPVRRLDGFTFICDGFRFGLCLRGSVKYPHHVLFHVHVLLVDVNQRFQRVKSLVLAALLIFSHT